MCIYDTAAAVSSGFTIRHLEFRRNAKIHIQQGDLISMLSVFQNEESRQTDNKSHIFSICNYPPFTRHLHSFVLGFRSLIYYVPEICDASLPLFKNVGI
jgi:hypothetical protein